MAESNSIKKKADSPKNEVPKGRLIQRRPSITYTEVYSGPIPKGSELIKYEQACKGAASRIIKMAEGQTAHRQALERKVVSANIIDQRIGLIFALVLALSLVIAGTYLILHDKQTAGLASLISGPGFPAIVYFFVHRKAPTEFKRKDQEPSKQHKK